MAYTLSLLEQIADGHARQFGPDCEIVIHDLKRHDLEHSVVHINNGHITNRREGDGPSKVVLETLHRDPALLKDHLGYLTRTSNGKILKSSTFFIRKPRRFCCRLYFFHQLRYHRSDDHWRDPSKLLSVQQKTQVITDSSQNRSYTM